MMFAIEILSEYSEPPAFVGLKVGVGVVTLGMVGDSLGNWDVGLPDGLKDGS